MLSSNEITRPSTPLAHEDQREITRLCVQTALLLGQHGTESAVIENMARRLGLSLGVDQVEAGVFASAIILTTLSERHCITTVRRSEDRGINMHVVTEVQRAVLAVEAGELDGKSYRARLEGITPNHYPRWMVAVAIGLSCASFARLAHADWIGCGVVAVASGLGMTLRQLVARLHFSPLVNFFVTAFFITSIAGLSNPLRLGSTPKIVVASSVLLLVPGFPLINGVSDMVKGYWSSGMARLVYATLLATACCTGMLLAMSLWSLWGLS
jgi:uncharacterized membrane protein YjjP (DUF1212 family)